MWNWTRPLEPKAVNKSYVLYKSIGMLGFEATENLLQKKKEYSIKYNGLAAIYRNVK